MSADFWSFVCPMDRAMGSGLVSKLRPKEVRGDVFRETGEVFHTFATGDPLDVKELGRLCGGVAPPDLGRAYVEASLNEVEALLDGHIYQSEVWASVVALDRAVALPNNVGFLFGGAIRLIPNAELIRLCDAWSNVMAPGGRKVGLHHLARALDWDGNGDANADEIFEAVQRESCMALEQDCDLFILGIVAP